MPAFPVIFPSFRLEAGRDARIPSYFSKLLSLEADVGIRIPSEEAILPIINYYKVVGILLFIQKKIHV